MTDRKDARKIVEANKRISRPEEYNSNRERDSARVLGPGLLPEMPDAELLADEADPAASEEEAAVKRATRQQRRGGPASKD
jgi:hypothetical protein